MLTIPTPDIAYEIILDAHLYETSSLRDFLGPLSASGLCGSITSWPWDSDGDIEVTTWSRRCSFGGADGLRDW